MRFVLAIVAFAAAAVMIGFGIAQRTVFRSPMRSPSDRRRERGGLHRAQPDALAAHPGKQTITVSGAESVFLSYGRTGDVGGSATPYVAVGYDAEAEEFTSEVVVPSRSTTTRRPRRRPLPGGRDP